MKAFILTTLALFGIMTSSIAMASGDAGCGLGSMIISKNSKLLQIFALTTNASSFSQGFGITSGTSGCSASGIVSNDKQIEYFVEVNHEDISREMAQGRGEKLDVLAQLNGCTTKEAQTAFAGMTQKSYEKIIPAENVEADQVVENLKKEISVNLEVMQLCHIAKL